MLITTKLLTVWSVWQMNRSPLGLQLKTQPRRNCGMCPAPYLKSRSRVLVLSKRQHEEQLIWKNKLERRLSDRSAESLYSLNLLTMLSILDTGLLYLQPLITFIFWAQYVSWPFSLWSLNSPRFPLFIISPFQASNCFCFEITSASFAPPLAPMTIRPFSKVKN